jgi:hypothetical protein
MLGVIFGCNRLDKINKLGRHPYMFAGAYACYVLALATWDAIYPLQIVGVCLSSILLYLLGTKGIEHHNIGVHIILLGKYSLFGYIAQIAVLQLLYRASRHMNIGPGVLPISFMGTFILTVTIVEVVDSARARSTLIDRFYRAAFA